MSNSRLFRIALPALLALALGGCKAVVLEPFGDIAARQRDLLVQSTLLMLIIIVPVMALTVIFAWRYRQGNRKARYEPDWDHSMHLELVIWGAPLLIIVCLGALTWMGTHLLDPYRPIAQAPDAQAASPQAVASQAAPLEIQAVALDWKWLFIYPQYGVAAVNELAAPVDRPITFRITASSVMNSFYIPALAGQIYAMPGMQTKLHAVINHAGVYQGFSANYSGAGFSGMRFAFHGVDDAGFEQWIARARSGGGRLDRPAYLELEQPSENVPVRTYAEVDASLYDAVVNLCVQEGKMCMGEMMAIDARGGLGMAGIYNTLPLEYDKSARRGAPFGTRRAGVASLCTPASPAGAAAPEPERWAADPAPLLGAGLARPASFLFRPREDSQARRDAQLPGMPG